MCKKIIKHSLILNKQRRVHYFLLKNDVNKGWFNHKNLLIKHTKKYLPTKHRWASGFPGSSRCSCFRAWLKRNAVRLSPKSNQINQISNNNLLLKINQKKASKIRLKNIFSMNSYLMDSSLFFFSEFCLYSTMH